MIKSKDNQHIKYIQKLKIKKFRDEENKFLIFGDHLIEEAQKTHQQLTLYTSNPSKEGILIDPTLMAYLSDTITPHDRLGIVVKQENKTYGNKVLVLDDIQDPDNLGALIRSAVGFGFTTILSSNKSADYYNEKAIRTSQGALFYANLIRGDLISLLLELKKQNYTIIATSPHEKSPIDTTLKREKVALILGNEGKGISNEVASLAEYQISIKTQHIESLNVAVAGAICMYLL